MQQKQSVFAPQRQQRAAGARQRRRQRETGRPPQPEHFAMREHYASVDSTGAVQIEGGAPSTSQAALPAGWEGCLDPVSNRVFYHHAATRTSQWNSPLGGRSARVVRPPREPYPQTFDSEEPDLLVLSYPRMADCSKPDLAESHDQWRGEPGGGSITAELLPLPNMNAPQQ